MRYPVPLGLCGHSTTDKRRDRLSGLLSGLLGRRQCFWGKNSLVASVRFCGRLRGVMGKPPHRFRDRPIDETVDALPIRLCVGLNFFLLSLWNSQVNTVVSFSNPLILCLLLRF